MSRPATRTRVRHPKPSDRRRVSGGMMSCLANSRCLGKKVLCKDLSRYWTGRKPPRTRSPPAKGVSYRTTITNAVQGSEQCLIPVRAERSPTLWQRNVRRTRRQKTRANVLSQKTTRKYISSLIGHTSGPQTGYSVRNMLRNLRMSTGFTF